MTDMLLLIIAGCVGRMIKTTAAMISTRLIRTTDLAIVINVSSFSRHVKTVVIVMDMMALLALGTRIRP